MFLCPRSTGLPSKDHQLNMASSRHPGKTAPTLTWDYGETLSCSNASDLRDHWVSQSSDPKSYLMAIEIDVIRNILEMSPHDIGKQVDKIMRTPQSIFLQIRTQLHSLMILWERVIHAKTRLDEERVAFRGDEALDMQTFLMALKILPRRCSIGLKNLREAPAVAQGHGSKRKASPPKSQYSSSDTMDDEPLKKTKRTKKGHGKTKVGGSTGPSYKADNDREGDGTLDDSSDERTYETSDDTQEANGRERHGERRGSLARQDKQLKKKGSAKGGKRSQNSSKEGHAPEDGQQSKLVKFLRK